MLPDEYCGANSQTVFCAGKQHSAWCYSSLPWVISVSYWSYYNFIYFVCMKRVQEKSTSMCCTEYRFLLAIIHYKTYFCFT